MKLPEDQWDWAPLDVLLDSAGELGINIESFRHELNQKLSLHGNVHDEITFLEVYSYYDRNIVDAMRSAVYRMAGHDPITLSQYEILFHYMLGADDLHSAIKRIWDFSEIAKGSLEDASMRLVRRMGQASISINWGVGDFEKRHSSLFHSEFYRVIYILEWMIGRPLDIQKIDVPFSKNHVSERLKRNLKYPIAYDRPSYAIYFPEKLLNKPIVRGIDELKYLLKVYPAVTVLQSGFEKLSIRIEHFITSRCISSNQMLSAPQLANLLNMSETSMRRKLKSEGTSYGEIRRRCQEAIAKYLLKNTNQEIGAVGYQVGFDDPASFRRAFKSWTGETPGEARQSPDSSSCRKTH